MRVMHIQSMPRVRLQDAQEMSLLRRLLCEIQRKRCIPLLRGFKNAAQLEPKGSAQGPTAAGLELRSPIPQGEGPEDPVVAGGELAFSRRRGEQRRE